MSLFLFLLNVPSLLHRPSPDDLFLWTETFLFHWFLTKSFDSLVDSKNSACRTTSVDYFTLQMNEEQECPWRSTTEVRAPDLPLHRRSREGVDPLKGHE